MMEETTWLFLGATAALVAYSLFALGFYQVLRRPQPGASWLGRRLAERGADPAAIARARWWWNRTAVPAAVCAFAAVLAVLNVGIIGDREVEDIYAISAGVVAAVRVLAYAWDEPAEDLAKMVPIAVLSVALFNNTSIDVEAWRDALVEAGTENAVVYGVVLCLIEWGLQAAHDLRRPTSSGTRA